MAALLSAEQATAVLLSPEDCLALDKAFPTLQALRDKQHIIRGHLPVDFAIFPGKDVSLMPYYMNSYDPPELGMWKIDVEGVIQARLYTEPRPDSCTLYNITVKDADGAIHAVTQEEAHQLVTLINFIHEDCYAEVKRIVNEELARKGRLPARLGGWLLQHHREAKQSWSNFLH
jgi:hypothetical protein